MKYLKLFEEYNEDLSDEQSEEPINFEEVYGLNKEDLDGVLGYLIDDHDYLEYEITGDYKTFNIEIYDASKETKQDLKDEYKEFKVKLLPSLKKWLNDNNLTIDKEELDKERNRIVVTCKKIK